ncbi:MAG: hypothetical protein H6737_16455 [Alphaproteobacteria bacterium]|nr:hypothetical protein [Alphaproteobacteria bacterium]
MRSLCSVFALAFLVACKGGGTSDIVETSGLPVLGDGSGDVSAMLEVVGQGSDGLDDITDLAMNPDMSGELWTVNKADDSVVIYRDVATGDQSAQHIVDPYALHFMEKVTSIAFGAPGTFATCQDGRNTYNNASAPNDFTGPTLWSSDPAVFGLTNPQAVDQLGYDLGSHLDMLHESPQCMGIEWDHDNVYWVFDGFNGDIVRYDFQIDHGVGYDDHCDGIIERWAGTGISRVNNVVSHLALDQATGLLYIADTGNGRIAVLDTSTGERGNDLPSVEDGSCIQGYGYASGPDHYRWTGGVITDLVTGLSNPAGIALVDGKLFVTENGTGMIRAYDLEGNALDAASTGRGAGALQGIYADSENELWVVDGAANEVLRLRAPAANARR